MQSSHVMRFCGGSAATAFAQIGRPSDAPPSSLELEETVVDVNSEGVEVEVDATDVRRGTRLGVRGAAAATATA